MKLRMSRQWTRLSIPCEGRNLLAHRRADLTLDDGGDFVSSHLKSVVEDGGLLFQRDKEPTEVRAIRYPAGAVGYKLKLPPVELWYLPNCSFEASLGLFHYFGFPARSYSRIPGSHICDRPEQVRHLAKVLLRELHDKYPIALTQIASAIACFSTIDESVRFSAGDVDGVLRFNGQHFGVKHTRSEILDMRANYQEKGFLVLGTM